MWSVELFVVGVSSGAMTVVLLLLRGTGVGCVRLLAPLLACDAISCSDESVILRRDLLHLPGEAMVESWRNGR